MTGRVQKNTVYRPVCPKLRSVKKRLNINRLGRNWKMNDQKQNVKIAGIMSVTVRLRPVAAPVAGAAERSGS